jgi:hypothetical protein
VSRLARQSSPHVAAIAGYAFVQAQSRRGSLGPPSFVDETASAGIAQTYAGGRTFRRELTVGGGHASG